MEISKILRRTPSKIFCPLCRKWHKWEGGTLKSHGNGNPYKYSCECGEQGVDIEIWHEDQHICIESTYLCDRINDNVYGRVNMNLIESRNQINLEASIIADYPVNSVECCEDCDECCNLCKIGDKHDWKEDDELEIKFILKFQEE